MLLDVDLEEGEKCFEGLLGAELDILTSVRKLSTEHTSQLQGDVSVVFSFFFIALSILYMHMSPFFTLHVNILEK